MKVKFRSKNTIWNEVLLKECRNESFSAYGAMSQDAKCAISQKIKRGLVQMFDGKDWIKASNRSGYEHPIDVFAYRVIPEFDPLKKKTKAQKKYTSRRIYEDTAGYLVDHPVDIGRRYLISNVIVLPSFAGFKYLNEEELSCFPVKMVGGKVIRPTHVCFEHNSSGEIE